MTLLLNGLMPMKEEDEEASSLPSHRLENFTDEFQRPLTRYHAEKANGIRRETGVLKLKRLTKRHLRIITMHLEGWSGKAIAVQMNCSQLTVSKVLNDPMAKEIIQQSLEDSKGEIAALIPKAVNAVREGLGEEMSLTTKFKAIDKLEKMKIITGSEDKTRTAEDLVQELLASGASFDLRVSKGPMEVEGVTLEGENSGS